MGRKYTQNNLNKNLLQKYDVQYNMMNISIKNMQI